MNMNIKILFFAQLEEISGMREQTLTFESGSTLEQVMLNLCANQPKLSKISLRYSVNEEFSNLNRVLQNQDVIALLPPVGGG